MENRPLRRLGIIGGGQLCRMLLPYAHRWNLETHVLDGERAPAFHLAHHGHRGGPKDSAAILRMGKEVDIVTIDLEDVDVAALEELERGGKKVYPRPCAIKTIQDKAAQKAFLKAHSIPIPDFYTVDSKADLSLFLKRFPGQLPLVQKLRRGGYDGKGIYKIRTGDEREIEQALDGPSLLEEWVDVDKEVSLIVARNPQGDTECFPPVEMVFDGEKNILDSLFCPANLSRNQRDEVEGLGLKIAEALNLGGGILAIEFFLTKEGRFLVNELAPRPHNSGHHTIESCSLSQYEQHLRGILGLPLGGRPRLLCHKAAMWNIIGRRPHYQDLEKVLGIPQVSVHLYGKDEVRAMRKMGHVTVLGESLEQVKEKLRRVKEYFKEGEKHDQSYQHHHGE